MIEQVHASDPAQAQELFSQTMQGIGAGHRSRLEDLLRIDGIGGGLHGIAPERRTKEMTAEDKARLPDTYNDKLHRLEDGEYKITLRAGDTAPVPDDAGIPSAPKSENTQSDGAGGDRLSGHQANRHGKKPALHNVPRNLKGTTFFGGAGMEGKYISDMVKSLEEAGFDKVRSADPKKWSNGMYFDAAGTLFERTQDTEKSDFSEFSKDGEQFNLIGYSHGALQAAQAAADYADSGGKVDNLVLIGAPISQAFLVLLKSHPNIGNVIVKDLTDQGDPIHAGMSTGEQILAVPSLSVDIAGTGKGHFYYSGADDEGIKRRRDLAKWLKNNGLK